MNKSLVKLISQLEKTLTTVPDNVGFTAKEVAIAKGIHENTANRKLKEKLAAGEIEIIGGRTGGRTGPKPVVYDYKK